MRKGKCDRCGRVEMINTCTKDGAHIGEFCAYCFDRIDHDCAPRNKTGGGYLIGGDQDPGFDNVISAMEEDR